MAKAFSYVVSRDYGFAPNPFYEVLTLATCKPKIRKMASVEDFIIGNAGVAHGRKLIYMARVSEVMTFDQYWNDPRFERKKPAMNGSLKTKYGDNVYHHGKDGEWIQEDSHHSNDDGSVNTSNLKHDTETTDRILVCKEFVYLGRSMIDFPDEFDCCVCKNRGHHRVVYEDAQKLWNFLKVQYPTGGKIDQPNKFDKFKRYDGKS